jgi:predicted lipoprotein with Yx(FWY)xxD motif
MRAYGDAMHMRLLSILPALGAALILASGPMAATPRPAIRYVDDQFGAILATPKKQALYYWQVEKRAGGKIRCTGACAKLWPPLYAKSTVPKHVAGVKGTFGTIKRPAGRKQVTYNGLAVYTYAHEGPEQVLCDDVNGWFVVRLR